ncbi:MAG: hypothetical protein R3A11_07535 [Bdellovibrionota bacterium]
MFAGLSLLWVMSAGAESFALKSGEIIEGKVTDHPAKITIKTDQGEKRTISFEDLLSYSKEASLVPTASSHHPEKNGEEKDPPMQDLTALENKDERFDTPLHTFETWKEAALSGDIKLMSQCYVSYLQEDVKKSLKKLSKTIRKDMAKSTAMTNFIPDQPEMQSDTRASLDVTWAKDEQSQTQTLHFQKEKEQWKLIQ